MPRFDSIDACRSRVLNVLNGTSPPPGLSLVLTYDQCLQYCGTGYGTYPKLQTVNALADWVIPLFLLLGNITYSKSASTIFTIRGKNFGAVLNWLAVVSHLLVNPLDFLWSLALKLDSGRAVKKRIYSIYDKTKVQMTTEEKKHLCGVCYALEDFENGIHIDTLLQPLEKGSDPEAVAAAAEYWGAIRHELELTARNIAGNRRHNKLHSVLAIIVYGKDVFAALIQAELDENFEYQMPHTLALRQLYYWLVCAIILCGAAGGFADKWSSHAFLDVFLKAREKNLQARQQELMDQREQQIEQGQELPFRYDPIFLKPIEPWNGGNYNWRYPKKGQTSLWKWVTWRKIILLLLTMSAVAVPSALAFIMSWETPTKGLGDRGIMELSYCGMWVLNWIITIGASFKWDGKMLFKIYYWNTFWSVASLFVLFAAFQGWYNNCASWSAYYSRGASGARIDLNMKDTIERNIFRFYLPITAASLVIQLLLAGVIIGMNWDVIKFTAWSDDENRALLDRNPRPMLYEDMQMDSVISRSRTPSRSRIQDEERDVVDTTDKGMIPLVTISPRSSTSYK